MPLSIRTGISNQTVGTSKSSTTSATPQLPPLQVGKVMGVVTTKNTPTFEQFEFAGGYDGAGSIYFINYDNSKNIDPPRDAQDKDKFFKACDIAKPLFPNMFYYPLLGELVYILEGLPSPSAQNNSGANQKYYVTTINLWNDVQTNAQTQDAKAPLGKYFTESSNIRKLLNFEGDCIIQGRRGNSIRFGSTSRVVGDLNEWSDIGKEGNPITIISNGHSYNIKKEYYLEQINKDASSIYLTSNQSIPLVTNNIPINPITSPTVPSSYLKAQVIINSDRVILSTKKDDIMLLAYTNVEIGANNIINLNANTSIHLNIKPPKISTSSIVGPTPLILLGTKSNNTPPDEPVLLGGKTATFLLSLLTALDAFALSLTATSTNSEGSPLAKVQGSAEALQTQLKPLYDKILTLKSNYTFTI
jgi:hypothetical protein